jgi:hypothetical protein
MMDNDDEMRAKSPDGPILRRLRLPLRADASVPFALHKVG